MNCPFRHRGIPPWIVEKKQLCFRPPRDSCFGCDQTSYVTAKRPQTRQCFFSTVCSAPPSQLHHHKSPGAWRRDSPFIYGPLPPFLRHREPATTRTVSWNLYNIRFGQNTQNAHRHPSGRNKLMSAYLCTDLHKYSCRHEFLRFKPR